MFSNGVIFKISPIILFHSVSHMNFFPLLKTFAAAHVFTNSKKKKNLPTSSKVINTGEKTIYFRLKNLITLKKKVLICSSGPPQYGGE